MYSLCFWLFTIESAASAAADGRFKFHVVHFFAEFKLAVSLFQPPETVLERLALIFSRLFVIGIKFITKCKKKKKKKKTLFLQTPESIYKNI